MPNHKQRIYDCKNGTKRQGNYTINITIVIFEYI